jgi:hypothetical protein
MGRCKNAIFVKIDPLVCLELARTFRDNGRVE